MDLTMGAVLMLGLVIGLQHALEADHLAAVTAMVSGEKSSKKMIKHGAFWGLGHSITLLLVAGTAVFLGAAVEGSWASWLEFIVGVMLVGLGLHVLWRMWRSKIHFHVHDHGDGEVHFHAHSHGHEQAPAGAAHRDHDHDHVHAPAKKDIPWRSLAVGLMHGMAGSAALIVLTASQMANPLTGLIYVGLFGIGSILGMVLLSAVISVPLGWTARSLTRVNGVLQTGIGAGTTALGLFIMYETQIARWLGV